MYKIIDPHEGRWLKVEEEVIPEGLFVVMGWSGKEIRLTGKRKGDRWYVWPDRLQSKAPDYVFILPGLPGG